MYAARDLPVRKVLSEKPALPALYRMLGERFRALDAWSAYVITSYEGVEEAFGRRADKNRKVYNGMLKTYFYEFRGPKPPRREQHEEGLFQKMYGGCGKCGCSYIECLSRLRR